MGKMMIVAAAMLALMIGGQSAVLAGEQAMGEEAAQPGMGPGGGYIRLAKALKLTDDQQSQIRAILASERGLAEPLLAKLGEIRKLLMRAGETSDFDETSVRGIASEIAQIETELAVIRVRTQCQIYGLLTAEQKELAKALGPEMERTPFPPPFASEKPGSA